MVWSEEELELLRNARGRQDLPRVAKITGRSLGAVKRKVYDLELTGLARGFRFWTTHEIALLKEHYKTLGAARLAEMLGRPRPLVSLKAGKLGLHEGPKKSRWTPEELDIIAQGSATQQPLGEVVRKLGRSVDAVRSKAHLLGLKLRHMWDPKDTQTLAELRDRGTSFPEIAEILGYTPSTVRKAAKRLGLFRQPAAAQWTHEAVFRLRALCADGVPLDTIAERLQIPKASVTKKAKELRLRCVAPKGSVPVSVAAGRLGVSVDELVAKLHADCLGTFSLWDERLGLFVRQSDLDAAYGFSQSKRRASVERCSDLSTAGTASCSAAHARCRKVR